MTDLYEQKRVIDVARAAADADLRRRVKTLFSDNEVVRADAQEALKEAWNFDEPSFNLDELASMDTQAATLAAMRRDTIKEVITWITKI